MQNQKYYIKYLDYQPVMVETLYIGDQDRIKPLTSVGDLITAYKETDAAPRFDSFELTLQLPDGINMSSLKEECFSSADETNATLDSGLALSQLSSLCLNDINPLIIKSRPKRGIQRFLSNTLAEIEKRLENPLNTGIKRSHFKTPRYIDRWQDFKTDAANYDYPTTAIGKEIVLPLTSEIKFQVEKDVEGLVRNHLSNFNRIFAAQGKTCRFQSKVDTDPSTPESEPQLYYVGAPDIVLALGSKVLSFVEFKTPIDLPVRHHETGDLFDLLDIYREDVQNNSNDAPKSPGDIGRVDVRSVIDHIYGYMSLNNVIYGCASCYDVTYFLWRPKKGTLLISNPIFNGSREPTLLQALYYFVELALKANNEQQKVDASLNDSDISVDPSSEEIKACGPTAQARSSDDPISKNSQEDSFTSENMKIQCNGNITLDSVPSSSVNEKTPSKYRLDFAALRSGTVVGEGSTGQVIRLKDSNIVVKHCDSYNNPDGFEMLQNEISVYEKLSKLNLKYIPRYYGECEFYGQHFVALEYIPGDHCDWRGSPELTEKLKRIIRKLKSFGVIYGDLKPENVILTPEGKIKLIDFGKAHIK